MIAAFFGVMAGFGSLIVFTFSVFLKPITAEFGWSREAVSSAFGFAAVSVAVASPKLGQLLDRLGPRRVILPCYIVYALALSSLATLGPHISQFYATFVVTGLVGNATTQMGYSRAVSTWFDARRGLALALVMSGTGAGSILLPALAQWMIEIEGWRFRLPIREAGLAIVRVKSVVRTNGTGQAGPHQPLISLTTRRADSSAPCIQPANADVCSPAT